MIYMVLLMNGSKLCQLDSIYCTVVDGAVSNLAKITCGVPQGSVYQC